MQCSLTALARLETEVNQKPFDVIIGHSQGAAMAIAIALINARAEEGIEPPLALPSMPKALVLYSGFPPQDASLEKAYSVVEKQGGLNISSTGSLVSVTKSFSLSIQGPLWASFRNPQASSMAVDMILRDASHRLSTLCRC